MRVLDAQIERARPPTTARVVRRVLLRKCRRDGVQRIDEDQVAAPRRGPLRQRRQVSDVADPPRVCRAHRIELHHPAPPAPVMSSEAIRGDDDRQLAIAELEAVPAEWQAGRNTYASTVAGDDAMVSVLEAQLGRASDGDMSADRAAQDNNRRRWRARVSD